MPSPRDTHRMRHHHESKYWFTNGARSEEGWIECIYCGLPADTRDHVPPLNRVEDYQHIGLAQEFYLKVPSCKQCNSLANEHLQDSIFDRIEFVKDKLARKYARLLKSAHWTEDELEELGPVLRSQVREAHVKAEIESARIDYYFGYEHLMDVLEIN